jgi:3-phenylpropionate/trans-cinnamate dioxygenase ferredoxin subunit
MAWIKAASTHDVPEGEVLGRELDGNHIALYRYEGEYFAGSNVCTHQFALLSEGYFEDGCIECPLHQASFDVRTGKALCAPATEDIKVFPVKVEGDDIFVDL